MTVKELIESLKREDPDAEVRFAYIYPDHWSTELAGLVETVDRGQVVHSDYHQECKVADGDDDDDEVVDVVLLR